MGTADYIVVLTTTADREDAERIARHVVRERFAACAQTIGPIRSTYWWEDALESSEEWLGILKTKRSLYPALEAAIKAVHPYDVPEIVAIPAEAGNPKYFAWLEEVLPHRPEVTP